MSPPATSAAFLSAEAKLKRAREDLQTLGAEVLRFEQSNPYSFAVEFDGEWWTAVAKVIEQPSPDLSVLVGDVAYQCYSAFHHIVWELASRKKGRRRVFGKDLKSAIQIPVATKPKAFSDNPLVTRALVSKPALAVIEGLQPYKELDEGGDVNTHPLCLMKEIADSDKHRVLAAALVQIDMTGVAWKWDDRAGGLIHDQLLPFGEPINDGDGIARVKFVTGNDVANVRVDPQPKLKMLFNTDNWTLTLQWVFLIYEWAEDRMQRFAPLFPAK